MKTEIKLCGFKRMEDIVFASSLDINYLGMIFVENVPRTINIDTAIKAVNICKGAHIKSVGVFLNQDVSEISNILNKVDLDIIQLHGNEDIEDYKGLNKKIIKTIHVTEDLKSQLSLLKLDDYLYLLDATDNQMIGGTGKTFNWNNLNNVSCEKLFIAGGLKPDNILDLLHKCTPKCVDVSSGIESEIGSKDHSLMRKFVNKVRIHNEKEN